MSVVAFPAPPENHWRPRTGPIRLPPFKPLHLRTLGDLGPEQEAMLDRLHGWLATVGTTLQERGLAWTVTDPAGKALGCFGFIMHAPGRAMWWGFFASDVPAETWPAIHNAVLGRMGQLATLDVRVIEADMPAGFEMPGSPWPLPAPVVTTTLPGCGPDGSDLVHHAMTIPSLSELMELHRERHSPRLG